MSFPLIVLTYIAKSFLRDVENMKGVSIGGRNLTYLRYADDIVLIAESEQDLQNILNVFVSSSEAMGLELNVSKTECNISTKMLSHEQRSKYQSSG